MISAGALIALAVLGPLSGGSSAQSEATTDGGTAVITVVDAGSITIVNGTPTARRPWPYTCSWFVLVGGSDIESSRTTTPRPGDRHRLICNPRDGFAEPQINELVIYDPADPVPGTGLTTSAQIRDVARDALRPNPLLVGISPADVQITGVETWLWPDGSIDRVRVSASAGGLMATVEARYQGTTFAMDEPGVAPISCTTQTIWTDGADSTPCAHTYFTEAANRTVLASSEWDYVWWDNAGQPTAVDLATVAFDEAIDIEVIDLEAVISRSNR